MHAKMPVQQLKIDRTVRLIDSSAAATVALTQPTA